MKNYISTPTISEMLKEEFMEPLGLTAYRLAKDIKVPVSRIQEILHDKRRITADTDLRLCKYFGMSNGFFLRVKQIVVYSKRYSQYNNVPLSLRTIYKTIN